MSTSRIYRLGGQIFKWSTVHILAFNSLHESIVADHWYLLTQHFLSQFFIYVASRQHFVENFDCWNLHFLWLLWRHNFN